MGHELIDKIIEQTHWQLPSWSREKLGVFMFSSETKDALTLFARCAKKLFAVEDGFFIAPSSSESLNDILNKIQLKKERHKISPTATVVVREIVSGSENGNLIVPADCKKMIVRLVQNDNEINDDEFLFTYATEEGLQALLIFSYLQDMPRQDMSSLPSS